MREIEEFGKFANRRIGMTRVGETGVGVSQLIEEWMGNGLDGRKTAGGSVLQESSDQVNGLVGSLAEDLEHSLRERLMQYGKGQEKHTLLNGWGLI